MIKVSNVLSSSRSLVANTGKASSSCNDKIESAQSVAISDEDRLSVDACIGYEEPVTNKYQRNFTRHKCRDCEY